MWQKEDVRSSGVSVFWQRCSMAAACLAMSAGSVVAFDVPRIWCWDEPDGDALTHDSFIQMIRVQMGADSPADVAEDVVDLIGLRGLGEGEVCVLLQNYGNTTWQTQFYLWNHPDDRWSWVYADPKADPPVLYPPSIGLDLDYGYNSDFLNKTPYFSSGIAAAKSWTEDFVDNYVIEQSISIYTIPDPVRFHFDSETPRSGSWTGFTTCIPDFIRFFNFLEEDATEAAGSSGLRWQDVNAIHGFEHHFGSNDPASLEDLFDEFKTIMGLSSSWIPTQCLGGCSNGPCVENLFEYDCDEDTFEETVLSSDLYNKYMWYMWYASVIEQSRDAALAEAAYVPIKNEWATAKCSNYNAVSFDGVSGRVVPSGSAYGAHSDDLAWPRKTSGDFSAPVLYFVSATHFQPGEDEYDAALRRARKSLDAIYHSYGGGNDQITPWHLAIGQSLEFDYEGTDAKDEACIDTVTYTVTAEHFRDMHALMRAKRIQEAMLWWNHTASYVSECDWDDMADAVDSVWGFDIDSVSTNTGSAAGSSGTWPELVAFSTEDYLEGTCALDAGNAVFEFEVEHTSVLSNTEVDALMVNIEATTSKNATATVYVYDHLGSSWVQIEQAPGGTFATGQRAIWSTASIANDPMTYAFVSGSGEVNLKVRFDLGALFGGTAPTVDVDLVQVIAVNESSCPASAIMGDLDGNGLVNIGDLASWLAAFGDVDSPQDTRFDINGDGTVDVQDLSELIKSIQG